MPPYFSGSVLAAAAIVTSAPDCLCAATSAGMSTSVSVSPLTMRKVDASSSGSAWRGPPAEPSTGFSHE